MTAQKGPSALLKSKAQDQTEISYDSLIEATELLEASRERYAEFYDSAPVGFVSFDGKGIIKDINLPGMKLFGGGREKLIGYPFVRFVAAKDMRPFLSHLTKCKKSKDPTAPISVELALKTRNERPPVYIELISVVAGGPRMRISNIVMDVTDRRRSIETRRRLAAIVESSNDAILSIDERGNVSTLNGAAEILFGRKGVSAIGVAVGDLLGDEEHATDSVAARSQRGEGVLGREMTARRSDGARVEVTITMAPLKDVDGRLSGSALIIRDITQQKQAERALSLARDEAERPNRAKDDFLAALSHELRTPLNPVLLVASDMAADEQLSDELRSAFDFIRRNTELEARLIDDMLDLTRIAHGKLNLQLVPVAVHSVLREATNIIGPDAAAKRIELAEDYGAGRDRILGDAARLEQVAWNILKNAVKFTPEGGRVSVSTSIGPRGNFILKIADTGVGLAPEELTRIFDAFAQGRHARKGANPFGGLGLGLAISKKLVELHSGTIEASSPGCGKGTTLTVTLPLFDGSVPREVAPGAAEPPPQTPKKAAAGVRILLVEDHEAACKALETLLLRRNHEV